MGRYILKIATTIIEKMFKGALLVTFIVLIMVVVIQVVGRAGVFDSPVWTEELSRFALLYLAALGVGLSVVSGDLVNVDIVCEALPYRLPWILRFVSAAISLVLSVGLVIPAWKYTIIGRLQTSPALGLRMDSVHITVLVLLLSLAFFSLLRVLNMVYGISDGRSIQPDKLEDGS